MNLIMAAEAHLEFFKFSSISLAKKIPCLTYQTRPQQNDVACSLLHSWRKRTFDVATASANLLARVPPHSTILVFDMHTLWYHGSHQFQQSQNSWADLSWLGQRTQYSHNLQFWRWAQRRSNFARPRLEVVEVSHHLAIAKRLPALLLETVHLYSDFAYCEGWWRCCNSVERVPSRSTGWSLFSVSDSIESCRLVEEYCSELVMCMLAIPLSDMCNILAFADLCYSFWWSNHPLPNFSTSILDFYNGTSPPCVWDCFVWGALSNVLLIDQHNTIVGILKIRTFRFSLALLLFM